MEANNERSAEAVAYEVTSLKRAIGIWGSFSMGYADVGADIFIALSIVFFYTHGLAPIAFLIASITYVATGLCYAELASTYPVAGGAQFYALKAFGDVHSFVSGWALMLDYTIDIALFSLAAVGYLSGLFPIVGKNPYYVATAMVLIAFLTVLNIIGIKESSKFNEVFVAFSIGVKVMIIVAGALLAFKLPLLLSQFKMDTTTTSFLHGISLAMVSYIGIESISQAAEETIRPEKVIPKASFLAIALVIFMSLSFSILALGMLPYQAIATSEEGSIKPIVTLTESIPIVGSYMVWLVIFTGFILCTVSTNTGVIGVSRVSFSMSRLKLLPKSFYKVHPKFRTPYKTIAIFSAISCVILLSYLFMGRSGAEMLRAIADLYNFGSLLAYMYVNASLIVLRNKEPDVKRPWKIPGSIRLKKGGRTYEIPIIPLIGLIMCFVLWCIIIALHEHARILGPLWILAGLVIYTIYRKRRGLPVLGGGLSPWKK